MQFEGIPQEDLGQPTKTYMPVILSVLKYVLPVIALALFFLFVIRPLMSTISSMPAARQAAELPLPRTVAEIERAMESKALPLQPDVIEWARKNPDQAANLLKGWIEER
jgi:flagellar biosynthesis/type III secretory pathway M-ring protein FliF/YscJ